MTLSAGLYGIGVGKAWDLILVELGNEQGTGKEVDSKDVD